MPGFTTHYLFGVNAYKDLKNTPLKKNICGNHAAYSLGLQGPDLFFYYLTPYTKIISVPQPILQKQVFF